MSAPRSLRQIPFIHQLCSHVMLQLISIHISTKLFQPFPPCGINVVSWNIELHFSQLSNKAASSVDKEKLLKKYFHRRYPYAAFLMCTSDCGSGCFKVLWCILSLILGASD